MAKSKSTKIIWDVVELLIIGVGILTFSWFFLAEPLEVIGDSMTPTLHDKEQIIAEKFSINFEDPKRGEVVVFSSPKDNVLLVKRVVALPGESFVIQDNSVTVDGIPLFEVYLDKETQTIGRSKIDTGQLFVVPADSYIVLGDNRENSTDSRDFGPITKESIVGRAFMVYQPTDNIRIIRPSEQR